MSIEELIEKLHNLLIAQQKKLATAESCTGGKIAASITDLAGSSSWFDRGFVTYSNQSKIELLAVKSTTLEKYGAVSEQVAREMVMGCLDSSLCDYALSITGVAGPTGGSAEKPVGTVWFAWASREHQKIKVNSQMQRFDGDRKQVREQSVSFAINELLKFISSS